MTLAPSTATLHNQLVVLLGGTSGIGFAAAQAALAAGASVVVASSSRQRVTEALAVLGGRAEGHALDVADEAAVQALFARIGSFDHLVYSAGDALQIGPLAETAIDAVRKAFEVRVFGAIAAVKHAAPHLRPGGSVVLTGGVASLRPQTGWTSAAAICGESRFRAHASLGRHSRSGTRGHVRRKRSCAPCRPRGGARGSRPELSPSDDQPLLHRPNGRGRWRRRAGLTIQDHVEGREERADDRESGSMSGFTSLLPGADRSMRAGKSGLPANPAR
jgi:hypothetical protein